MPHATEADIAPAAAPQHGMATEADVLPEQSFGAGAAEFGHQWGGFFEGLWNKAKGAVGALLPDDPSKAAVNAPIRVLAGVASALHNHIDNLNALRDKAEESLSKGNIADFLGHLQTMSVEGVLPGVGQAADAAKAKWDSGDKVGATADAAALTSQMLLGAKAGDLARAGLNAAAYTTAAARAGGPGVLGGLAKAGVGEVLAKVPGMELPARFGLQYPALRDVSKALAKGTEAGRAAIAPEAVATPEAVSAAPRPRPASAAPRSATSPAEAPAPAAGKPTGTAADMMNAEYGPSAPAAPAPVPKSPGQVLYESDARPTDVPWERVPKDQQAMFEQFAARPTSAAGAPPSSPTPSAPSAQPTPAAPSAIQPNGGPLRPPLAPQPAAAPSVVSAVRPENPPSEALRTANRTFVKDNRPSAEDYTLMEVPTAKIDAGWSKEGPAFYIPPGGGGAEIEGRLARAQEFIQGGTPVEAPRVSMAENGRIAFEDGRHRFAAMRDAGDPTVGVMVPHEQVADFRSLSKPAPTPASKAPSAASIAEARNAQAKADRFVAAIQQYNQRFNADPITADAIAGLDDAGKSVLTRALKGNGLLKNTEKFTDTSFPYIVTKLRQLEYTRR